MSDTMPTGPADPLPDNANRTTDPDSTGPDTSATGGSVVELDRARDRRSAATAPDPGGPGGQSPDTIDGPTSTGPAPTWGTPGAVPDDTPDGADRAGSDTADGTGL